MSADHSPPINKGRTWRFFTMGDVRVILIAIGVLTACVGGLVLLTDIPPRQYPAIAAWMVGALIVHDVLIAGVVFAVAFAGRRAAQRIATGPILIVQCALALGGIVALIVVPEIVKDAVGTANPSILPLDYTANLAIFLAALAVVTVTAVALHIVLARRAQTPVSDIRD
jgi:hypothetical protein